MAPASINSSSSRDLGASLPLSPRLYPILQAPLVQDSTVLSHTPLLDVQPRGRNQDKPVRDCVASCINHLGLGTRSIITSWCLTIGSGHRQFARQVGASCVTSCLYSLFFSWMANEPRPFPAGTTLRFGSFDFVATGDGYGTDILPSGANPDTPTPPFWHGRRPRRHAR